MAQPGVFSVGDRRNPRNLSDGTCSLPARLVRMFIAVSGNIGAGKSTLVNRLAQHYGGRAELEAVADNPYLNDFYNDMARWAFPLQIYFLNNRFRQGLSVARSDGDVFLDRTIYEDAEVFARNLYELGYLSTRDYQNYRGIYESMRDLLPAPDLVIYLRGSVAILQERIAQRHRSVAPARQNEDKIPAAYLQQLNERYAGWVNDFSAAPVVTIDIDLVDLARPEAFNELVRRIDDLLP